jgi:hypothetical protein
VTDYKLTLVAGLWDRLRARWTDRAARQQADEAHMSDADRRLVEGDFEGYQADEVVEERLGGHDPQDLLEE